MKHFLFYTWRIHSSKPFYTLLNLTGLIVGLSAAGLILLYVIHELSYDRFHSNRDRLCRAEFVSDSEHGQSRWATITAAVGPALATEVPGIESTCRITRSRDAFFPSEGRIVETSSLMYADSTFFRMFSFRMLRGNPATALSRPGCLVITPDLAERLFGQADPLGQLVRLNNRQPLVVTGIASPAPAASHIQYEAIVSFSTLYLDKNLYMDWDGGNQYPTWVLLSEGVSAEEVYRQTDALVERELNEKLKPFGVRYSLVLESLSQVYLYNRAGEPGGGNLAWLMVFSGISMLILLLAGFNYTSLSNALAITRARETGIRKVLGWSRQKLAACYLAEGILLTVAAWIFSLLVMELLLPWFSGLTGKNLDLWASGPFLPFSFLLALLTGTGASLMPALMMASFEPVRVLKGAWTSGRNRSRFSKGIVAVQFFATSLLILLTLMIFRQQEFIQTFDKGYEDTSLAVVSVPEDAEVSDLQVFRERMGGLHFVEAACLVSEPPGAGVTRNGYMPEGSREAILFHVINTDTSFFKVTGISVTEGEVPIKPEDIMVNQSLVRYLGWNEAPGKSLVRNGPHRLTGVVEDFVFGTLHESVQPLVVTFHPSEGYGALLIRLHRPLTSVERVQAEQVWNSVFPAQPFVFYRLQDYIREAYQGETAFGGMISGFSLLALIIALFGLLGMVVFYNRLNRRQASIHLLLGATRSGLVYRMNRSMIWIIALSAAASWPFGWYLSQQWFSRFAFHTAVPWVLYPFTAFALMVMGLLGIVLPALRNLRGKAPDYLRYE